MEGFGPGSLVPCAGLLCTMPGRRHRVGHLDRVISDRRGVALRAIDLDRRWTDMVATHRNGRADNVIAVYVPHVPDQTSRYHRLVNRRIVYLPLSAAHVDVDAMAFFRDIFPARQSQSPSAAT